MLTKQDRSQAGKTLSTAIRDAVTDYLDIKNENANPTEAVAVLAETIHAVIEFTRQTDSKGAFALLMTAIVNLEPKTEVVELPCNDAACLTCGGSGQVH